MADKTMLNFKYGIYDRLPEAQVPGTIYVTADEKAMYVDLPAVTGKDGSTIAAGRIRLGSVIIHESVVDFEPPYSAEAIYYSVKENALLRWNPTGGDEGTGAWVQINSVKAIDDKILEVAKDVEALEGAVTALQGADTRIEGLITAEASRADAEEKRLAGLIGDANGGLTKALADEVARADAEEKRIAGLVSDNAGAITGLQGRMDTAEGEIDALQEAVGGADSGLVKGLADAVKRIGDAEAAIQSNDGDISTINGNISTINGTLSEHGGAITALQGKDTELGNSISALEQNKLDKSVYNGKIEELTGLIGANKTAAENAQKAADDAQADANENAGAITAIQGAIGDANSGLTKRIGDAETAITNLGNNKVNVSDYNTKVGELNEAIAAAKKAGDDAQADANENAGAITAIQAAIGENGLAKDIADLDGRLDTAEGTLTNHGGRIEAVEKKASDNASAIEGHGSRLTTVEGKANDNAGAITGLQGRMDTAEGKIADLEGDVADLDAKIGTIPADSDATNVIDYINSQFEAADAMQYKGGVGKLTDLPVSGVEAGHTYVITANFVDGEGNSYYAGDLLVAAADQGAAETYAGGWTHVVTGYQASHDAELSGSDNKIKLTSLAGSGVSLGEIAVETDGSMLTATVADNKLSLGLEWGSF
jgi:chromosome segregation ATPase